MQLHLKIRIAPEDIAARGGARGMVHIDWMIRSDRIDIDGLDPAGGRTPIMRKGEWA